MVYENIECCCCLHRIVHNHQGGWRHLPVRSHTIPLDGRARHVHTVLEACHRTWCPEHINGLHHCRASVTNSLEPEYRQDEEVGIDLNVGSGNIVSWLNLRRMNIFY